MNNEPGVNGDSIGVVLFQLGGPDSLEAIQPFLYNLFSDPDIIDFPFARRARPTLARLISSRRAKHVQEHYVRIGGKSPIGEWTERQALALEKELTRTIAARVFVAMRYWHPLTADTIREIKACSLWQLVLLPLYPQYSRTTTGSSLNEWNRHFSASCLGSVPVRVIQDFHSHPLYIAAIVERINRSLQKLSSAGRDNTTQSSRVEERRRRLADNLPASTRDVHLIFSAHGVPMSVIEAGDPYRTQVEATTNLVLKGGGWPNPHSLCYQSRVGPGKWLQPSLESTLRRLASDGATRVLVIPIAFVSDHVETLHEIDIEARETAETLGIRRFETMEALNDSPTFIRALADLVLREVNSRGEK